MGLFNWFKRDAKANTVSVMEDKVLSGLIQSLNYPVQQFNEFKIEKAVTDGYAKCIFVYRCVNLISQSIVALNFQIIDEKGQKVDTPQSKKIIDVLNRPNPLMPPNDVYDLLWKQQELTGSAYLKIARVGLGETAEIRELWPLYPDKMSVLPSSEPGKLVQHYVYQGPGGETKLRPDQVIHFKDIDPSNGLNGIGALRAAFRLVDISTEQDKWNYNSLLNRIVSDIAIRLEKSVGPEAVSTIRQKIMEQFAGGNNGRRVLILPKADEIMPLSQNAVDMDFNEGKKITREEILSGFGVPPTLVGILDKATYNNVETEEKIFWEHTLLPKIRRFCNTLTWAFQAQLPPGHKIWMDLSSVRALQVNYTERINNAKTMNMFLGVPLRECNRIFELGIDEKVIDEVEAQAEADQAMLEASLDDPAPEAGIPTAKKSQTLRKMIGNRAYSSIQLELHWRLADRKRVLWWAKAKKRFVAAFEDEKAALLAYIKKNGADEKGVTQFLHSYNKPWKKALDSVYSDVIGDFANMPFKKRAAKNKKQFNELLDEATNRFIRLNTGLKINQIKGTTMKKVENIIKTAYDNASTIAEVQAGLMDISVAVTDEVTGEIGVAYTKFSASRALMIARTEVGAAAGEGQQQAFDLSGFEQKMWIASMDKSTRDSHAALNGEIVDIDKSFSNGLMYPGDPAGGADEIINCRCTMVPA